MLSTWLVVFAPVSGTYYIDMLPCKPSTVNISCAAGRKNIPILAFHRGNNTTISYLGGEHKNECLPAIPYYVQEWAARDGLGDQNVTTPLASNTAVYRFGHGYHARLVELVYDSVIGHDWPSTLPNADNEAAGHHPASFNATPIILQFFEHHPLGLLGKS
jgi:poly(3-hydroxybutyrate) depolymerase